MPALTTLMRRSGARTVLDLFTGTTRVAQAFKEAGGYVTAVDTARYAEVFARCRVELDASSVDLLQLKGALEDLSSRPGRAGYFTETFCVRSRFFQPFNGERIDAIRDAIEADYSTDALYPVLLTSLIEAADRVDSTAGVQMAYVKQWSARSFRPLELRAPDLLEGPGRAVRADAQAFVQSMAEVDLAYLDPPYNQHRYFTNYHVWETLTAWDAPDHYGVACKRIDARDEATKSVFNSRRTMPAALGDLLSSLAAATVILSYNDESWISLDQLVDMCSVRGHVEVLAFDSKRYVGAQIGIHNQRGEKVGAVSHLRNTEYVLVAGERGTVRRMTAPFTGSKLDLRAASS